MVRTRSKIIGWLLGGVFCFAPLVPAQSPPRLDESGRIVLGGRQLSYRIRRLPVSSFPELPEVILEQLNQRGCLIPQTYQAHRPENVIHGRFERPGSSDWAVLCAVRGTVSLLVFFGSDPGKAQVLATVPESERLQQHDASGELGFNWGIDPATPQRVHEAQTPLAHRPPWLDHDALADSLVDRHTVYHFYSEDAWTLLNVPDN